jgi:DNA-binding response OmpR family regulator
MSGCACGLRDRLDELEEENRQLKEMLAPSGIVFPADWRLTEAERRVLAGFLRGPDGYLSHRAIVSVYVKFRDRGDTHYTSVIICKMHHKLKPHGIEFVNRHGHGYQLTPASRVLIRKALAASEIVEVVKECFMPGSMT